MEKIGRRVKNLRENMGLTDFAIADYLNIPIDEMQAMEKGEEPLTASIIGDLCDLYGCEMSYLLCKTDEFKQPNFALRSDGIEIGDLKGIALMNRIYKNLIYLNSIEAVD